MNVSELMTSPVRTCTSEDNLQRAAQLMWECDCGAVPVVDGEGRIVSMITDRDVCMAAYTRGEALWQIPVSAAMAKQVFRVNASERVEVAIGVMRTAHVHRVPVVDGDGRVVGILSMNNLARHVQGLPGGKTNGVSTATITQTLAAIGEPHARTGASGTAS
jgi:CBS domain-containing protein